jgi:FkbM family methyltransferase
MNLIHFYNQIKNSIEKLKKKIYIRARLISVLIKKSKVPLKWRYLFLKCILWNRFNFWTKRHFCLEFYKKLQTFNKGEYYDFNGLRISFYPFKSDKKKHSTEHFVEYFLTIIFPFLYRADIYHPLSYIESNYIDNNHMQIKPKDIVFDCGGFAGYFAVCAAKKAYKGKVFVFEPFMENYKLLLKNINQNNLKNIHPINKAVGERESELDFIYVKKSPSGSGIYNEIRAMKGNVRKIICTTLDKIYQDNEIERVDFIKMDIEGMERSALLGAKEVISKFKPKLSICTYHHKDDPIVIPRIIKQIRSDYKIKMKTGKLYAY